MPKNNRDQRGNLLWAFNPFQDSRKALKNACSTVLSFAQQAKTRAEPVYVVSPSEVNVVLEFSVSARERYRSVALAKSQAILKALKADHLEPTILVEKSLSLSASTKALATYARKTGAQAIVAGTRSGAGLGASLLGSFSEALLYQSACPVLLVKPSGATKPLRRLLFVSDLSRSSLGVFDDFCGWASALNAEVLLFHSIPRPFSWASFAIDSLLGPDRMPEKQYLREASERAEGQVGPFREMARRHGARFSHQIGVGGEDVAAEALKMARKQKIDLIGAAGKSGKLRSRILGSVTKSLLGDSKLPFWIKHSH